MRQPIGARRSLPPNAGSGRGGLTRHLHLAARRSSATDTSATRDQRIGARRLGHGRRRGCARRPSVGIAWDRSIGQDEQVGKDDNLAVVERWFAALGGLDIEGARACWHEDAVWRVQDRNEFGGDFSVDAYLAMAGEDR